MPPSDRVDLSPGAVLHVKDYASRGHHPKSKYVLIIGSLTESEALGFLISSQLGYLQQESHRHEVIRLPQGSTAFLSRESMIQCFELERLSVQELCDGFEQGRITNEGRLSGRYLHKIREAVTESRLLAQIDIEAALKVLPVPG